MARIIKTLIDEGPLNKTKLATYSELSYDKLMNYIVWLSERDFIREDDGTIFLMEKGVDSYHRLVEWILNNVGKLKFSRRKP